MGATGSRSRRQPCLHVAVRLTVGVLPLGLLVRTAEYVQEHLHIGDSFMGAVIEHGKVMYSSEGPDAEGVHAPRCL